MYEGSGESENGMSLFGCDSKINQHRHDGTIEEQPPVFPANSVRRFFHMLKLVIDDCGLLNIPMVHRYELRLDVVEGAGDLLAFRFSERNVVSVLLNKGRSKLLFLLVLVPQVWSVNLAL